jgi:hypothetical protein
MVDVSYDDVAAYFAAMLSKSDYSTKDERMFFEAAHELCLRASEGLCQVCGQFECADWDACEETFAQRAVDAFYGRK